MARIGIDARFYGSLGKGLGRYTQKLIQYLEHIDRENQYVVFLRKENFDEYVPKNENFTKVLADYRWYTFSEQIFFPRILRRYALDLVHFPHFNVPLLYRDNFVVTIHDLILIHFPTVRSSTLSPLLYWIKFFAYKITIKSALTRARQIIAVSQFTKKDIIQTYGIAEERIAVTYEACDITRNPEENNGTSFAKKYGIIKPYLLYIGNVYPHKNPEHVVRAMKEMQMQQKDDLQLVFVGGEDFFYQRLKKFIHNHQVNNVIFVGQVNDKELEKLFLGCFAYVRPSLYEGFELPPLEAMSLGAPVLSSDHACAQEILGESALYFKKDDVQSLIAAIEELRADKQLRTQLIERGYAQVAKYSWDDMAKRTFLLYQDAIVNTK